MAYRYLIYSTGTTYSGTILKDNGVVVPSPSANTASFYTDFVIPEIQPLYLWQVNNAVTPTTLIPNTDAKITNYENATAPAPQPNDLVDYSELTGATALKIDKVTGANLKIPVFNAGGNLQSSGYSVPELTGLTTYTFQGSGGTTVTPMGGNLFRFYSTPPTGTSVTWNDVTSKPSWLSGTTVEAFQTGHTHAQYALKVNAITGATNLGSGNGSIFTTVSNNEIQLKTLSGGTNISITCNGNYIAINATGGGTLSWTGSTANGVGTYVNSGKICSQPNMTFDGTALSISGNICASQFVCSPIISGSSKVCSPIVVGTSCVTSPVICASSCVRSPLISGQTLCATSSAFAPTPTVDNNSTCVATTAWYFGQSGNTTPVMDGSALIGTSLKWAHADHVHPSDTSRITKLTGATPNDIVTFGVGGALSDSGKQFTTAVQTVGLATNNSVPTELAVRNAINQAVTAAIILQGDWNALTNSPNLTSGGTGSGYTTGYAWRVSVSGATSLGGLTPWRIGDMAIKVAQAPGWVRVNSTDISALWGNIGGTLSNQTDLQNALNAKQNTITGAATSITGNNLTINRAVISDGLGKVAVSPVSSTELSYLSGASSNIQAQLNSKLNTSVFTGYTASTKNKDKKIQLVSTSTLNVNVVTPTGVTWNSAPYSADTYLWSASSAITVYIKSAGTYEVQYHVVLKNDTANQTHSIGGYIVKNGATTLANTATAGMVVGVSASGELSLPPVVQTFANNDKLVLTLFRIGSSGTVNLVANSVTLTLNKLT